MEMSRLVTVIFIVILFVLLLITISSFWFERHAVVEEKVVEFKNDPDDKYVQWLTKTRNTLLEMLLNTLVNAWQLTDEDAKQASSTQTEEKLFLFSFS